MAAAWVQAQGTATVIVGSNTSIALTTLHNLAAGNTLVVGVRTGDGTGGGYACSDGTHAFNLDINPTDANLGSLAIFSYYYPLGLTSGATITISWTHVTLDAMATAHEFSGFLSASWTDKTAAANAAASGTTPSSGATAALSQSAEVAVGIVGYYQTGATATTLSGTMFGAAGAGTAITGASAQVASTYEEGVLLAYQVLNSTTAVTFAPTLSISATYAQAGVVTYKAAVPGNVTLGAIVLALSQPAVTPGAAPTVTLSLLSLSFAQPAVTPGAAPTVTLSVIPLVMVVRGLPVGNQTLPVLPLATSFVSHNQRGVQVVVSNARGAIVKASNARGTTHS